jgi:prophage DNA circulation protein
MPWQARVREGAYRSPKGTRITFEFEDVSRVFTKRTAIFDFAGVDESYVQQNGHGSRRYPLRCFFWGSEHDRIAAAFEAALLEHGVGRLEHPFYGPLDVVPIGDVTRRDDLVTGGNQSVIEVTFSTTLAKLYPGSQAHPQSEVLSAISGFDVAAAQVFKDTTALTKVGDKASLKGSIRRLLSDVNNSLTGVADAVASVRREFHDIQDILSQGIDTFVGAPLLLAQQVSDLIKAPARVFTALRDRLSSYDVLIDRIFDSPAGRPGDVLVGSLGQPLNAVPAANAFRLADHAAMVAITGSIVAAVAEPISDPVFVTPSGGKAPIRVTNPAAFLPGVGAKIATRTQALSAASALVERFERVVAWRDAGFASINSLPLAPDGSDPVAAARLDTGEAYQALQQAVALATGYLIQISFTAAPERRFTLKRERTIIDLCAELYGSVDDKLDFLIVTNDLSGDEIKEIPRGREIVFYPTAA